MSQEKSIDYRAVLADLEVKRTQLDQAISAIRLILGEQKDDGSAPPVDDAKREIAHKVKSDTFFGLSATEAAKKYLAMAKEPRSNQQIADAIKAGGVQSLAKNFYSNVFTALSRDVDTFIKIKRGQWGLKEWYPGAGRSKTTKENEKSAGREGDDSDAKDQEPKG